MNIVTLSKSEIITGYRPHSHSSYEITYQLSGTSIMKLNEKAVMLEEGSIVVIPPECIHEGEASDKENGMRDMSIRFRYLDAPGGTVVKDKSGDIRQLFYMLERIMLEQERDYAVIADGIIEVICRIIKKNIDSGGESYFVRALKDEIYENISNPDFDLSKSVEKTGFNKDHLRRKFKRETGKTPLEYLTDLRLARAKQFLERVEFDGVDSTARSCGFYDSFYFSTCFKKKIGISPLKYRKSFLEKNDSVKD